MKYLCLAYGDEKDWNVLTKKEQDALLAPDEALRKRGVLMAAVQTTVTTVRAWDGQPVASDGAFAASKVPLAGFSIIEAADLNEVIQLVAGTPCARAKGAIEIRPIMAINVPDSFVRHEWELSHLFPNEPSVHTKRIGS
jgi:hypothetical protein